MSAEGFDPARAASPPGGEMPQRRPSEVGELFDGDSFLEVGDLQVIKERLSGYRRDYGDAQILHDLEFLLSRTEAAFSAICSLLDRR